MLYQNIFSWYFTIYESLDINPQTSQIVVYHRWLPIHSDGLLRYVMQPIRNDDNELILIDFAAKMGKDGVELLLVTSNLQINPFEEVSQCVDVKWNISPVHETHYVTSLGCDNNIDTQVDHVIGDDTSIDTLDNE